MKRVATKSLAESKYLLEHAIRVRGLDATIVGREYNVRAPKGSYSLSFLPGNRRVLISHYVKMDSGERGKGFGQRYMKIREQIAREAGANLMLATVRNDNAIEIHLLKKFGWRRFTNRRSTGVSLWGKLL